MEPNYYELLQIPRTADDAQIQNAIRETRQRLTNLQNSSRMEVEFQARRDMATVAKAQERLLDPEKRKEYDAQLDSHSELDPGPVPPLTPDPPPPDPESPPTPPPPAPPPFPLPDASGERNWSSPDTGSLGPNHSQAWKDSQVPSVGTTIAVTALTGPLGIIPAFLHSAKAKTLGFDGSRYFKTFGVTLGVATVVHAILWLGIVPSMRTPSTPETAVPAASAPTNTTRPAGAQRSTRPPSTPTRPATEPKPGQSVKIPFSAVLGQNVLTSGNSFALPGFQSFTVPRATGASRVHHVEIGGEEQPAVVMVYNERTASSGLDPESYTLLVQVFDAKTGTGSQPRILREGVESAALEAWGSTSDNIALSHGDQAAIYNARTGEMVTELPAQHQWKGHHNTIVGRATPRDICTVYAIRIEDGQQIARIDGKTRSSGRCSAPITSLNGTLVRVATEGTDTVFRSNGAQLPAPLTGDANDKVDPLRDLAYLRVGYSEDRRIVDGAGNTVWSMEAERGRDLGFIPHTLVNGILYASSSDESLAIDTSTGNVKSMPKTQNSYPVGVAGRWLIHRDRAVAYR